MKVSRASTLRCLFTAWIFAWFTAIYIPSGLIAALSLSPLAGGANLFADAFQVADEVSPAAKLTFATLFGALLIPLRMGRVRLGVLVEAGLGLLCMLLVLAFLPETWSQGFGIGLTGSRFVLLPTAIYLGGGFLSGVVFSISEANCARNRKKRQLDS